jgi:hypothetical protein
MVFHVSEKNRENLFEMQFHNIFYSEIESLAAISTFVAFLFLYSRIYITDFAPRVILQLKKKRVKYIYDGKENLDLWLRLVANGFFSENPQFILHIFAMVGILHRIAQFTKEEFPYASNNFT